MTESKKKSKDIMSLADIKITNGLSGQDICEIIKTCGEVGVTEFRLSNLSFSFQARTETVLPNYLYQSPGPVTANTKAMDENSLIRPDEINAKENVLDNLHIEDPLQFEELLAQRELEDSGD